MHDSSIEIGDFVASEAERLGIIFFEAVRIGATEFYDLEQRQAWAPRPHSGPTWLSRLTSQRTVVARKTGLPVGFMTLDSDGYLDLAFVAPEHQRQGIGTTLYARIESLAREAAMPRLHSQASYLVRGLFERQGWVLIREQQIEKAGVTLTNFLMEKCIHDPIHRVGNVAKSARS